ncbi:MAG: tetraacyldisaccharide 4'-kinase [Desulfuromonadales bacterium]|nr:tetraacyldisaccharide 4'-kinase [Desulfuromonadales bacterium]
MSLGAYWRDLASGKRNGLLARLVLALLVPPSLAYSLFQRLRAGLYRTGVLNTKRLPRSVISIGNIAVGGTGKTPVTAYIARLLLAQGLRVAVLFRGYGGTCEGQIKVVSDGSEVYLSANECGDEPFLLARTIPGLMVVIGSDRHAAGLLAMEHLKPDIFLLDDGFQHLRLHRDLNILLLDYFHPYGNGWGIPAGLLREPKGATLRADLVIHTRCPKNGAITCCVPGKPALAASHCLIDVLPLRGGGPLPFSNLLGHTFLAFAGIAQPEFFFSGLRERGIDVVHTLTFPDHADYDHVRLEAITAALQSSGAEYAITTEKDGVKLKQLPDHMAAVTYVARLDIELEKPADLLSLVRNLLQKL